MIHQTTKKHGAPVDMASKIRSMPPTFFVGAELKNITGTVADAKASYKLAEYKSKDQQISLPINAKELNHAYRHRNDARPMHLVLRNNGSRYRQISGWLGRLVL